MTSISKNMSIDKLVDMVNEYNDTYHRTIKIKPVNVKPMIYIVAGIENNEKVPKFGDHVRKSKHKSLFSKRYTPN